MSTTNITLSAECSVNKDSEESDDERDLTNLMWLTELRNQTIKWSNQSIEETTENIAAVGGSGSVPNVTPVMNFDDVATTSQQTANRLAIKNTTAPKGKCSNKLSNKRFAHSINGLNVSPTMLKAAKATTSSARNQAIPTQAQAKRPTPTERYEIFLNKVKRDLNEYEESAESFQNDTAQKPPFNYSHIIGMAMLEKGRVTLQQICSWIESKFAFFRVRKKWNNSIRHNLSLHHCFRKIERNKYEKGKGGYWELGVDPRKCDRKRIRNRKSTSNVKNRNNSKKEAFSIEMDTEENFEEKIEEHSVLVRDNVINYHHHHHDNMHNNCLQYIERSSTTNQPEELLLDDLDIQENIDVCSTQIFQRQQLQQPQHPINVEVEQESYDFLIADSTPPETGYASDSKNLTTLKSINDINNTAAILSPSSTTQTPNHHYQNPQYQLGTIIISTTAADFASAETTLRYLLNDNYTISEHVKECPDAAIGDYGEGSIMSATFDNSLINNTITDVDTNQGPNVIVEQLDRQTTTTLSQAYISVTSPVTITNNDYHQSVINDSLNFRPYTDGIEEAFQYLRRMDNNREDILDNLLDISVSDY